MTYEELVQEIRDIFGKADVSNVKEHLAYQFNIEGEAEGAFYAEVSDGKLSVEPYEYYDRDVLFTTTADTLIQIASGNQDAVLAFTTGKLKVEGDFDKALLLQQFSKAVKKEAKKEAKLEAKKEAEEKKEAVRKEAEAKKEEKKEAETKKEERKEAEPKKEDKKEAVVQQEAIKKEAAEKKAGKQQ